MTFSYPTRPDVKVQYVITTTKDHTLIFVYLYMHMVDIAFMSKLLILVLLSICYEL